jgi:DNA-3-methyladenine glycosylase
MTKGRLRATDPSLRALLAGPTLLAGPALLGARLIREDPRGRRVARIVEVEAYIGEEDRASHARFGRTARNAVMYGPPGIAYVYLVYGMHDCLNIVTEPSGTAAAVLVRAIEPEAGIEAMRASRLERLGRRRRADDRARDRDRDRLAAVPVERLASGPGLVCAAFDIDRSMTGVDLCDASSVLRLEKRGTHEAEPAIVAGPRVGVAYAGEGWANRPWRLAVARSPSVSGPPLGG